MNGKDALRKAGDGGIIRIANKTGYLHLVWHDARTGKLRICRPAMLDTTHGPSEQEWEVVGGQARDLASYMAIIDSLGVGQCTHCIQYSKIT